MKFQYNKSKIFSIAVASAFIIAFVSLVLLDYNSNTEQSEGKSKGEKSVQRISRMSNDSIYKVSNDGFKGFPETVELIMEREKKSKRVFSDTSFRIIEEFESTRKNLPQNPNSPDIVTYPQRKKSDKDDPGFAPQTVSTSFTGATLLGTNPTYAFPPDNMGAVGPTQFIVAVNGRIVTFNKTTGTADGVINADMDVFFNSVVNGSYTSDPRIRYDRMTQKWFIVIINVSTPNRILLSVSNTSTISASTVWTFYYIPIESVSPPISNTCLADYPTLGIDANALYIGTNNFCGSPTQTFNSCDGYVIKKSSIANGGTMELTVFRGLVPTSSSAGPFTPQGVDNPDAGSSEGYFIGVDNATYGTLMIRRVSNPGGTPSISSNISLTVPSTSFPVKVRHLGNTGGTNGYLDALDDRLYAAQIRNGKLWTAHNIGVTNTGSTSGTRTRNAIRWYELQNLTSTPSLLQSGTIYTSSASNDANQLSYWIPTVGISGQNHIALSFCTAGSNNRINAGTAGRLSTDETGTMQTPVLFSASSTAYNPPSDPGGSGGRRWGDYSYVSIDPEDDMTMWAVNQFCDATNSYGVRVAKLLAPPPAGITSANPSILPTNNPSIEVTVTGTSVNGSGFFDPGSGFAKRISASVTSGIIVNSITYNSPTQITLNLSTVNSTPGIPILTVTNPDGQQSSGNVFDIALPVKLASFNANVKLRDIKINWNTTEEFNNSGFDIERKSLNSDWQKIVFVNGNNKPSSYEYTDKNLTTGKYQYRLKQIDFNGNFEYHTLDGIIEVGVPSKFDLSQNYPNPFNPVTKINFDLPKAGQVSLKVFDILGKEVKTLVNEFKDAGYYNISFDASGLPSGVYFYRISAGEFSSVKKLVLMK